MKLKNTQLERQREWHGWAFREYAPKQVQAIRHYIETGEKTEDLPGRTVVQVPSLPLVLHAEVTTDDRTSWVIKNRQGVVICRSPKRYRDRLEAIAALELFMEVVGK